MDNHFNFLAPSLDTLRGGEKVTHNINAVGKRFGRGAIVGSLLITVYCSPSKRSGIICFLCRGFLSPVIEYVVADGSDRVLQSTRTAVILIVIAVLSRSLHIWWRHVV